MKKKVYVYLNNNNIKINSYVTYINIEFFSNLFKYKVKEYKFNHKNEI